MNLKQPLSRLFFNGSSIIGWGRLPPPISLLKTLKKHLEYPAFVIKSGLMIKLLARICIKNSHDYESPAVREKYGILCGFVGVFLNILLSTGKFIFGTLVASVAMVADALNNLSDAASSLVQIVGFKLASKKPDREHPFGHGRMEYVAGLVITFLILYMGVELVKRSIMAIIHPEPLEFSVISIFVMIFSILVKIYMYFYNHLIGRKIDSVAMEATAKDSLSDVVATSVVLLSVGLSPFTKLPLDGIGGVIVGLFIFKNGIDSLKDTMSPLLGQAATQKFVNQLEEEALLHPPISEIHDVMVHDYGPGKRIVTLHAEVPGNLDVFTLHDAIDAAEEDISKKFNCQIVIHMDPVDVENKRLAGIKKVVAQEAEKIAAGLKVHDVRLVGMENPWVGAGAERAVQMAGREMPEQGRGPAVAGLSKNATQGLLPKKLCFDLLKPPELKMSDDELRKKMQAAVQKQFPDLICEVREVNSAYL